MAKLLLGKEVTASIYEDLAARSAALLERGITPTLAVIRIGENPGDLSYERGAEKNALRAGVRLEKYVLPPLCSKQSLLELLDRLNGADSVHGVLLFRPLPPHLQADQCEICNQLDPRKDVDSMTHLSNAGVYEGCARLGFAPCTAQACMEVLHHYGIDCRGKSVAVLGRSLVIGKPVAMLLAAEDATVTLCHSRTPNVSEICRRSDLIVTCCGKRDSLTAEAVRPGQVILDVSINWDPEKPNAKGTLGAVTGDCRFAEVEPIVEAITPVPGGIGAVTTAVLFKHLVEAAESR